MISRDDIEAFEAESQPAFRAGRAFVRRRKKGLPVDRWATGDSMSHLVADCLERQWVIIGLMALCCGRWTRLKDEIRYIHPRSFALL